MYKIHKVKIVENFSNTKIINNAKSEINTDNDYHYIGLVIINCSNITDDFELNWDTEHFHLNYTSLYLKDSVKFPIIKIDHISKNFRYKKYIRNHLRGKYDLLKENILGIKFYEVYKNLHNYIVVINKKKNINNSLGKWRDIINWFKIEKENKPSQDLIYKSIMEALPNNNICNYKFFANNLLFNDYFIEYFKILSILKNLNF